MSPLTNEQKRKLALLARAAYLAKPDREAFEAINSELSPSKCFEAWRHVETGKATGGIQSLRSCTQSHYGSIKAHFLWLAGDAAGAAQARAYDVDNARRIARYKLDEALRQRGLTTGYAVSICRAKYKCSLADASAAQIWKLAYDVRQRRKAAAKAADTTDGDNPF